MPHQTVPTDRPPRRRPVTCFTIHGPVDDGDHPWTAREHRHHLDDDGASLPPRRFATQAEADTWVQTQRARHNHVHHLDHDIEAGR